MKDSRNVPSPLMESSGDTEEEPCELWYQDEKHKPHYYRRAVPYTYGYGEEEGHCPGWRTDEQERGEESQ